jgi:hypothetical protein
VLAGKKAPTWTSSILSPITFPLQWVQPLAGRILTIPQSFKLSKSAKIQTSCFLHSQACLLNGVSWQLDGTSWLVLELELELIEGDLDENISNSEFILIEIFFGLEILSGSVMKVCAKKKLRFTFFGSPGKILQISCSDDKKVGIY